MAHTVRIKNSVTIPPAKKRPVKEALKDSPIGDRASEAISLASAITGRRNYALGYIISPLFPYNNVESERLARYSSLNCFY